MYCLEFYIILLHSRVQPCTLHLFSVIDDITNINNEKGNNQKL